MANLPGFSKVHREFAVNAPGFKEFGAAPLIGWISGFHLDDVGKVPPQVFNGQTSEGATDKGIAAYIELPQDYYAEIGIVNLFHQGDGPTIQFQKEGFAAETAMVDGQLVQFADWCREKKMNVQLPLVADYAGAMINVSFQAI